MNIQDQVMLIRADAIGKGDGELGRVLVQRFINEWVRMDEKPNTLIMINAGVHLVHQHAPTAKAIKKLIDVGVNVYVDLTSVEYYRLNLDELVGTVIPTQRIVEILLLAPKVLTL